MATPQRAPSKTPEQYKIVRRAWIEAVEMFWHQS